MYLRIILMVVLLSMESLAMHRSLSRLDSTTSERSSSSQTPRDYANKIGMVCSYNASDPYENFFMEIGEKDHINEVLEKLGTNKKVIFFVNGYGENMNPDNDVDAGLTFEWFKGFTYGLINDENTIACAFDFNRLDKMGPACLIACYWNTVTNRVPFASKMIKKVAAEMFANNVFTTFENFELIGFSLGAHIAGLTARRIKTDMGMEVPRIFALEPARRILNKNSRKQLQKTDARYVQAIFTSTLGQQNIDVHCKVFINDAATQPGCENKVVVALQFCSHNFAVDLYKRIAHRTLTLKAYKDPDENVGVPNVPNEMIVGHHSNVNPHGVFFANTDNSRVKKPRLNENKK